MNLILDPTVERPERGFQKSKNVMPIHRHLFRFFSPRKVDIPQNGANFEPNLNNAKRGK